MIGAVLARIVAPLLFVLLHLVNRAAASWNGQANTSDIYPDYPECIPEDTYVDCSLCLDHPTTAQTVVAVAQQAPPSPVQGPLTKSGWSSVSVNPNTFISAVYKNQFRANIYRNDGVNDTLREQYYYSPALVFDPTSVKCSYNKFNEREELVFSVITWDEEYELFVMDALRSKLGRKISKDLIRILPIEEIRISALAKTDGYELYDKWVSFANQPASFAFRFIMTKPERCDGLRTILQNDPVDVLDNLMVHYSLQSQRLSKRQLDVTAEHMKNSRLAAKMLQQFPNSPSVLMTVEDEKEMTMDIATNIMGSVIEDEGFVSKDQGLQLANLIESLLKSVPESSKGFDAQMWNSVFWNDDNARPDKEAETLNENWSRNDSDVGSKTKNESSHDKSIDINLSAKGEGSSGNVSGSGSGSFGLGLKDVRSEKNEKEDKDKRTSEAKSRVEWKGEKFTPKPLNLKRVNTNAFKSTTKIATTQVQVGKMNAELSTKINVVDWASNLTEYRKSRDVLAGHQLTLRDHQAQLDSHQSQLNDHRERMGQIDTKHDINNDRQADNIRDLYSKLDTTRSDLATLDDRTNYMKHLSGGPGVVSLPHIGVVNPFERIGMGGIIRELSAPDSLACQKECDRQEGCRFTRYRWPTGSCSLWKKSWNNFFILPQDEPEVWWDELTFRSDGLGYWFYPHNNYLEHTIRNWTGPPEYALAICQIMDSCNIVQRFRDQLMFKSRGDKSQEGGGGKEGHWRNYVEGLGLTDYLWMHKSSGCSPRNGC